jgi:hypothetical protein
MQGYNAFGDLLQALSRNSFLKTKRPTPTAARVDVGHIHSMSFTENRTTRIINHSLSLPDSVESSKPAGYFTLISISLICASLVFGTVMVRTPSL